MKHYLVIFAVAYLAAIAYQKTKGMLPAVLQ